MKNIKLTKRHLLLILFFGKGNYDYKIGVFYPDEKQAAMGAKASTSARIRW